MVRAVASQQRRSVSLNSLATPSPHPLRSPPDPQYMPYMLAQAIRKKDPNLDKDLEVAEQVAKEDPVGFEYYSALRELAESE